jgi:hypothetical protein
VRFLQVILKSSVHSAREYIVCRGDDQMVSVFFNYHFPRLSSGLLVALCFMLGWTNGFKAKRKVDPFPI